ncbi:Tex19 [Gossypium arboreum]|uniref:Tex19 n=1 Tax=Gossypium arboreum TaxID=29729 RepID=A0A0B0MAA1_GOSAR|nr:Tex19 [Gossypium arboreum]
MPLPQTGSYSYTYIGVTYRCQRIKRGLTCTYISESWTYSHIYIEVTYRCHICFQVSTLKSTKLYISSLAKLSFITKITLSLNNLIYIYTYFI